MARKQRARITHRVQYHRDMDEAKPTPLADSSPDVIARPEGEPAFPRGSRRIDETPQGRERSEHSVMEGLPPEVKAERIAAMRHELAEVQRQLSEAQQRLATALKERAEDEDRIEALEASVQEHGAKAQHGEARISELEAKCAALEAQLTTAGATTDELKREIEARDGRIEDGRRQHRDLTDQLEAQSASLRDAKAALADKDELVTQLATRTTERDEAQAARARLETELAQARKTIEETQTRVRDVAAQIARFGQELVDFTGGAAVTPVERPRTGPPPLPTHPPPVTAKPDARPVEVVEVIEEVNEGGVRSRRASLLMMLGGIAFGTVATFATIELSSSSSTAANPSAANELGESAIATATPSLTPSAAVEDNPPILTPPADPVPAPVATPTIESGTAQPNALLAAAPAATPEISTDGVLVLPRDASGHRLFVNGQRVELKGLRAVVPCGRHEVQIGSRGTPRTLDIECGGETEIPSDDR